MPRQRGLAVFVSSGALHGFQHSFGGHVLAVVELDALGILENKPRSFASAEASSLRHAVFVLRSIDSTRLFVKVRRLFSGELGASARIERVGGIPARRPES